MSDLVKNPEDQISRVKAHIATYLVIIGFATKAINGCIHICKNGVKLS